MKVEHMKPDESCTCVQTKPTKWQEELGLEHGTTLDPLCSLIEEHLIAMSPQRTR